MRKAGGNQFSFLQGWRDLIDGMVSGAKNMIGIGVATAAAGIVVGTITLTGIGQVMIELVELASGGNLMIALLSLGTAKATFAAVSLVVAHALFKAALPALLTVFSTSSSSANRLRRSRGGS